VLESNNDTSYKKGMRRVFSESRWGKYGQRLLTTVSVSLIVPLGVHVILISRSRSFKNEVESCMMGHGRSEQKKFKRKRDRKRAATFPRVFFSDRRRSPPPLWGAIMTRKDNEQCVGCFLCLVVVHRTLFSC
jgi:hypothetical protein